ncbi:MAG: undecaprenyl-phosphate glucose phosphotransferase [Prevotellaceae bacterium]|nr:undecaprenyl-phosphate glucose phosphotransferase [Prevotellaceae bacterium]
MGDFFFLNVCFVLTFYLCRNKFPSTFDLFEDGRMLWLLMNTSYAISFSFIGIALDQRAVFIENILNKVTKTVILNILILFGSLAVVRYNLPRSFLILFSILLFASISAWRILARLILKRYRAKGRNSRNVIILGAGNIANEVYKSITTNLSHGYKFMGFFDNRDSKEYVVEGSLVKGKVDDVIQFLEEYSVDEIICALPAGEDRKAIPIIKFAENNMIRCYIVPDFKRFLTKKVNLSFLENIPIISLMEEPLQGVFNRIIKRSFDLVLSFFFLLTVFPLLYLVLGIGIKLSSPGPVFFRQKRTGKNGEEFYCIKFRTMKQNKDADKVQAQKGDDRITKIGAFMRKTNLDEMPQFINVFLGQMSIVGPRPHMLKHTEIYSQQIDKYMVRHLAKPGITGWAQVTGYRGETRELSEMEGRIIKDMWYIENWTFWLDIKIIYLTIRNMVKGEEKAY